MKAKQLVASRCRYVLVSKSSDWLLWLTLSASLLLGGCSVTEPPPAEESLATTLPESTHVQESWLATTDTGKVDDGWLKGFNDPRLEELVSEVMVSNQSIRAVAAQVDAAAALAVQAGSALKPTVGLAAGTSSADASGLPTNLQSSNAFLSVSWELDIWGRVRAGAAAGEAGYEATKADYEFARQSLVAQTAKAWFLATQIGGQKALAEETVDIYRRLLDLVESRAQVGKAQPQDLPLAKANLAGAQSNLRRINASHKEILRSIEVILGRYPSGRLAGATEFVALMPHVPAGLPAEILARRPDLIAAERRLAAAFFGSQQAEAARLPKISLTASAGGVDSGLANVLGLSNPISAIGADLFAPLYAGGALKAGVDVADAQQKAALAVYGQTVLQAFKDVETALSNEELFREREQYLQAVLAESAEAYRITEAQYEVGRVDLLSLLQTQTALLSAKSSLIAIRNERLAQRVDLHLALGGSFEEAGKN